MRKKTWVKAVISLATLSLVVSCGGTGGRVPVQLAVGSLYDRLGVAA